MLKRIISIISNIIIFLIIIAWGYLLYTNFISLPKDSTLNQYLLFTMKLLLFSLFIIVAITTLFYINVISESKGINTFLLFKNEILDKLEGIKNNTNISDILKDINTVNLKNFDAIYLIDILKQILDNNKIEYILKKIVNICSDLCNAERVSLFLLDKNKNKLVLYEKTNFDFVNIPNNIRIEISEGLDWMAYKENKRFFVTNIETHPGISRKNKEYYKSTSFMIFPLKFHNDNVFGILNLSDKKNPPFTTLDLEVINLITKIVENKIELLSEQKIETISKLVSK